MSTRNYAKGPRRLAANMGRPADAKHSVKIREGRTVRFGLTETTDLLDPARVLAFGIQVADAEAAFAELEHVTDWTKATMADSARLKPLVVSICDRHGRALEEQEKKP